MMNSSNMLIINASFSIFDGDFDRATSFCPSLSIARPIDIQVGEELPDDWELLIPQRPAPTNPDIDEDTNDADRRRLTAEWKEYVAEWERFDAYEYAFKQKLVSAYDSQYFETLRDDLLGFTHVCVSEMLDHLNDQCIVLTEVEMEERLAETQKPWDQDVAIQTFFQRLDKLQEDLLDDGIEWTERQKINKTVKEMYDSNLFDARDMKAWDKKAAADKTWVHLQTYFGQLYQDNIQYERATGHRHGFESAAQMREREQQGEANAANAEVLQHINEQMVGVAAAATADKEHIQQMSDATDSLLKIIEEMQEGMKRKDAQIADLTSQNGKLIDALAALGGGDGGGARKARSDGNRTSNGSVGEAKRAAQLVKGRAALAKIKAGEEPATKGMCAICNRHPNTSNCFELEKNKDRRPEGWKSMFT